MEGPGEPEVGPAPKRRRNITAVLANADRVKRAWNNFIDEFKSSFDVDELDPVLSQLKSLNQNCEREQTKQIEEDEDPMSQGSNSFDDDVVSQLGMKVFGNHLISKAIFSNFSIGELLPCRLVNSRWKETVNEILLGKQLTLKFISDNKRFYRSRSTWRSLDMLTEFLRLRTNFPCNRFSFHGGSLQNDDAQRFFKLYGSSISYLSIESERTLQSSSEYREGFYQTTTSLNCLSNILVNKTVNIKELVLKLFKEGSISDWFSLKEDMKLPLLSNLTFDCDMVWSQKLLLFLLNGAENLKTIEIGDKYSTSMLPQLPSSFQKSLVKMGTFQNFEWDPSVKLPVFKNVQHICLRAAKDQGSFLPQDSSFTATFPRLNTLSIELSKQSSSWKIHFPAAEKSTTVHTIIIDVANFCPPDTEKLLEMFPNLRNLITLGVRCYNLIEFAEVIGKFHKAVRILQIGQTSSLPSKCFPVMSSDSVLDETFPTGEILSSCCADIGFIWDNFVENNNHPLFAPYKSSFKNSLITLEPSEVQVSSRTRYRLHDSSTLILTKLLRSRGMTWEDALVEHDTVEDSDDEGFYMTTHEIMGVTRKSRNKVMKTVKTVQLLVLKTSGSAEKEYSVYTPNLAESSTKALPSCEKVTSKVAKRLWQKEYTDTGLPKRMCEHIYREGRCRDRNYGVRCGDGVREMIFHALSGPVLKVSKALFEVPRESSIGFSMNYAKFVRVPDDIDPFMGILIEESCLDNLKRALSTVAASVDE